MVNLQTILGQELSIEPYMKFLGPTVALGQRFHNRLLLKRCKGDPRKKYKIGKWGPRKEYKIRKGGPRKNMYVRKGVSKFFPVTPPRTFFFGIALRLSFIHF